MKLEDFDGTIRDEDGRAWNADKTARRPQLDKGYPSSIEPDFHKTDAGFVFGTFHDEGNGVDPYMFNPEDPHNMIGTTGKWAYVHRTAYVPRDEVLEVETPQGPAYALLHRRYERLLYQRERTEKFIRDLVEFAGFNFWDTHVCNAVAIPSGMGRFDGAAFHYHAVSHALTGLASLCTTMASQAAVSDAVSGLSSLKLEGDEHPFFSEATLYELLGKENARTVLARVRQIEAAAAATRLDD